MVGCGPGPPEAWAALAFALGAGAAAELPGDPGAAAAAGGATTNAVGLSSAGAFAAAFPFATGLARGCEPAFPFGVAAAFPFGAMAYDAYGAPRGAVAEKAAGRPEYQKT